MTPNLNNCHAARKFRDLEVDDRRCGQQKQYLKMRAPHKNISVDPRMAISRK
jgi:hypothetical protein